MFAVCLFAISCASTKTAKNRTVAPQLAEISTNYGNMVVKLYDSTPLHRNNFIKLVKEGFYDSLLFHRVIDSFMIQGGDPESKNAPDSVQLGAGEAPGSRIPAEFNSNYFHKKGALAAARDDNPEKASSNCQFYIVQGKQYNDTSLNMMECQIRNENPGFSFTEEQRKVYNTVGGTPFLDQNYTVFGEVIKGLEVIDKIAALPRDTNDRPLQNVRMSIRMLR
ncbi:peptidylprolyl isomerase [Ilyomonas limi]|uniref:peptidylprolyl isomerase n=2 Tax=Ilyomonas limi TaxID=2575867 RepID=A0A4U3L947_9BACT|nr:peptidylprolyl isomerase [Ilyomonas limi]